MKEFFLNPVEMLKKESFILPEVKSRREGSSVEKEARKQTQRDSREDSSMAWVALLIYVHIILFHIIVETAHATEEDGREPGATAPGDIIIGGIFPIHEDVDKQNDSFAPHLQPCVKFDKGGLAKALAMINAVEVMNKSPLLAELNVTLGYRIQDSCSDVSTALRATADFTQQTHCHAGGNASTYGQPVMAVIGASFSEISIAVARQLTLQMIPQISYSSTAVILKDKSRFPAFMRTIPNDEHQTAAMVRLLSSYGWNWVGIVTTDGDYGRSALDNFASQASEKGICVAFKSILPLSVTSQDVCSAISQTATTISKNPKVQVIVSFTKPTHMKYLYQELRNQTLAAGQNMESMRRVWVASDSWSTSSSVLGKLTLNDIGHVVGFTFKSGNLSSFSEYLSRLEAAGHNYTGNNSFLQEFYMQVADSIASGAAEPVSKAVKSLREHTIHSVEMAANAIAHAVASICRSRNCKTPGTLQPWQVLHTLRKQEFKLGGKSYMFDNRDMDQCLSCDTSTEWSPEGSSGCMPKALLFFSWQDDLAVVLLTFSALGILLALLVSALFLHQRDTPVVKAAGGPLSQVMLFSLIISFISAMLFVGRPNIFQCKARQVLFGISFTLCVSCILVKSLQILLAFQFNPKLQAVVRRLYQPFVVIIVCVALQVATCICWLVLKSPFNCTITYPTTLLEECNEGSYLAFGMMLGYIAVLAFVCFICAFKGRKLPQHYNEARFITFSMLLYLIPWLLFVPVYVTTSGVYLPAVEMVVILISNYGILSCHFFTKCYIIIFKKEQNTKSAFRKKLYEYSIESTHSVSVSESSASEQRDAGPRSLPADRPLKPAVVTTCIRLHRGSITQHNSLRRSRSI
ncbi:hypothetical protein PAMA_014671 [Pampus argenteus]